MGLVSPFDSDCCNLRLCAGWCRCGTARRDFALEKPPALLLRTEENSWRCNRWLQLTPDDSDTQSVSPPASAM